MRIVSLLGLVVTLLWGCLNPKDAREDAAIRETTKQYIEAYNRHDADALSQFWAPDAVHVRPTTGEEFKGRDSIREMFQTIFQGKKDRHLETTIYSIAFPSADQAVEKGRAIIQDDHGRQEVDYKISFAKQDGKWLITEAREIETQEAPSHYEHLKSLEWLVGNWVDQDEDVDIDSTWSFDQHKNFLTQNLKLKVYGKDELNVIQIVGWDPINERILSWVFDSDGGFGKGTWRQEGDTWSVDSSYTLPDGRRASSVYSYKKIDENTYTWSSTGRDVDGEILPNIGPIKVVRVQKGGGHE